jgi:hypothetical protein
MSAMTSSTRSVSPCRSWSRRRAGAALPTAARRVTLAAAALAVALLAMPAARADVPAAARAFTEGQAAQMDGKYERAADAFELAYSLSPSKEALRSAARMRMQAGHLARAANQAELLLAEYPGDPPSVALAKEILAKAAPELCKLAITCAAPGCTISAGGRAISMNVAESHVIYLSPGDVQLELGFDGAQATRKIEARAGVSIALRVDAPPRKAKPAKPAAASKPDQPVARAPRPARGLPRTVVYVGAGVTAALGAATLWSGLDTQSAHDDYVKAPTDQGWEDGRSKQLRTNILLGATAASAITTAVIAVYFTKWSSERKTVAVTPTSTGATVGFSTSF